MHQVERYDYAVYRQIVKVPTRDSKIERKKRKKNENDGRKKWTVMI